MTVTLHLPFPLSVNNLYATVKNRRVKAKRYDRRIVRSISTAWLDEPRVHSCTVIVEPLG